MKIYMAGKYGLRLESWFQEARERLEARGHVVTSRWMDGDEEKTTTEGAARMDIEDVDRAEALVFFGETPQSENRGGGRWFELGYAYAIGKECYAVLKLPENPEPDWKQSRREGHESVFTALEEVTCVTSVDELVDTLGWADADAS